MKELIFTTRHEVVSEVTGKIIDDCMFEDTKNIFDMESFISIAKKKLFAIDKSETIIIYASGLKILMQATYIAWMYLKFAPGSLGGYDMYPGRLIFAHHDNETNRYRLFDAVTGEEYRASDFSEEE